MSLYFWLHVLTVAYPLAQSFERRVTYYRKWVFLLPGALLMASYFLAWDVWFTARGVWGFNSTYLAGIRLLGLPLEEWLFFFTVPFACLFLYEVLNYFFPRQPLGKLHRPLSWGLGGALLVAALVFHQRAYTFWCFLSLSVWLLGIAAFRPHWQMGYFYRCYAVVLLPFFAINGVLTYMPVVWYNDAENLGIRLVSIPFEDIFYGMQLILGNVLLYEFFLKKAGKFPTFIRTRS